MFAVRRGHLLAGAVVLAAAVPLSACGDDQTDPLVATAAAAAPAPGATTASAGNAVAAYVDDMRGWVGCMRSHGVNLPAPGPKGDVDMGDMRARKSDQTFLDASQACRDKQPAKPPELLPTRPPLTAEQIKNARAYAACMRANGVPGFRDPGPDGYPVDASAPGGRPDTASDDPHADAKAGQICEPVLNGRPPTSYDPSLTGQG
ncbi:hypothetical protein [Mangrovihabitans endophyticus]|uniref:Lipoprotein n=1 Tax=Mangrovihabitans endophyticus TaxID=1751298 RepID=A0A8J3C634_9ACTN|nr:hypothetical protein [Mangrovihabitans endophyticus]GGL13238.1 hypothetical protein GCM10012284_54900 [Mangrovihabitans endophyticus]